MKEKFTNLKTRLTVLMTNSEILEYAEAARKGDVAASIRITLSWGTRTIKSVLREVWEEFGRCLDELRAELKKNPSVPQSLVTNEAPVVVSTADCGPGSNVYTVQLAPGIFVDVKAVNTGLVYIMQNEDGSTAYGESETIPDYDYNKRAVISLIKTKEENRK